MMVVCELVRLFKALGDENRLRILTALRDDTYNVCHLADHLDISQPTLSHHLKVLRESGLVRAEKDGQWIHCSLNRDIFREYGLDIDLLLAKRV